MYLANNWDEWACTLIHIKSNTWHKPTEGGHLWDMVTYESSDHNGSEFHFKIVGSLAPQWSYACAEERTHQVKECDGFSCRCFTGSEVCKQDLNAPQFVLLSFSQFRQCNQHHKNNHLCKTTLDLWVFLSLLLKRLLICLVCHRITQMKLKLQSELVEFSNKFLSFSFLAQKGSLMKIVRMMLPSCDEPFRKLLIVWEIKRFG